MAITIRRTLLFAAAVLWAAGAHAQEKKGFVNRTLDWGYKLVQGDSAKPRKKYFFAVPIIAYRPETRWTFGASLAYIFRPRQIDSITRPSIIRLNTTYSQNHQSSFRPYFDIFTRKNKVNIRGQYLYTDFIEYYWGVGASLPESNRETYEFKMHRFNVKIARQILPNLYAGGQFVFEKMFDVRTVPGGLLNRETVSGSRGYYASGFGATVYYDDRDNVYFPYRGQLIELSNCFYDESTGSGYKFSNITIEAKKFIQLWRENILAFHGYMNMNYGRVPFRMLGTLGSDSYMRGYYSGRLRDKHAMAFQAELRKTVWGPVSMVYFAGFGSVSNLTSGLTQKIQPNFGLGVRMKAIPRERMNMRLDVGFTGDGKQAIYITMNEAF